MLKQPLGIKPGYIRGSRKRNGSVRIQIENTRTSQVYSVYVSMCITCDNYYWADWQRIYAFTLLVNYNHTVVSKSISVIYNSSSISYICFYSQRKSIYTTHIFLYKSRKYVEQIDSTTCGDTKLSAADKSNDSSKPVLIQEIAKLIIGLKFTEICNFTKKTSLVARDIVGLVR